MREAAYCEHRVPKCDLMILSVMQQLRQSVAIRQGRFTGKGFHFSAWVICTSSWFQHNVIWVGSCDIDVYVCICWSRLGVNCKFCMRYTLGYRVLEIEYLAKKCDLLPIQLQTKLKANKISQTVCIHDSKLRMLKDTHSETFYSWVFTVILHLCLIAI